MADKEHYRYCGRLREVNEDDHDLRSGRKIKEFEMPGERFVAGFISFAILIDILQIRALGTR